MYVCIYACMHVWICMYAYCDTYVCACVSMYVFRLSNARTHARTHGWTDANRHTHTDQAQRRRKQAEREGRQGLAPMADGNRVVRDKLKQQSQEASTAVSAKADAITGASSGDSGRARGRRKPSIAEVLLPPQILPRSQRAGVEAAGAGARGGDGSW